MTKEVCAGCKKEIYPHERMFLNSEVFHSGCAKCVVCKTNLNPSNFAVGGAIWYCKPHYAQAFITSGGKYPGAGTKAAPKKSWKETLAEFEKVRDADAKVSAVLKENSNPVQQMEKKPIAISEKQESIKAPPSVVSKQPKMATPSVIKGSLGATSLTNAIANKSSPEYKSIKPTEKAATESVVHKANVTIKKTIEPVWVMTFKDFSSAREYAQSLIEKVSKMVNEYVEKLKSRFFPNPKPKQSIPKTRKV